MSDITLDQHGWRKRLLRAGLPLVALLAVWVAMGHSQFFQALNLGLPQGSVIALIAIGYSMVYGIIQLINFAHGEVFMLSAYLVLMFLWTREGFPVRVHGQPLWVPAVVATLLTYTTYVTVNTMGAATLVLRDPRRRIPLAVLVGVGMGWACWRAFLEHAAVPVLASVLVGAGVGAAIVSVLRLRDRPLPLATMLAAGFGGGAAAGAVAHQLILGPSLFLSALAIAVVLTGTIGVTLDTVAYKPLRTAPRLIPLITAIGMSIFFQALARVVWGPDPAALPPSHLPAMLRQPDPIEVDGQLRFVDNDYLYALPWRDQLRVGNSLLFRLRDDVVSEFEFDSEDDAVRAAALLADDRAILRVERDGFLVSARHPRAGPDTEARAGRLEEAGLPVAYADSFGAADYFRLQLLDVILVTMTLGVFGLLQLMLLRTKLGKAMRACAQDKTTARLVGVNVDLVVAMTFLIGSMLAAAVAPLFVVKGANIRPDMGLIVGILAFSSAVLGGIGNIKGAMVGGMLIGIVYNFVPSLEQIDQWAITTTWRWISAETALFLREEVFRGISQWRLGIAYGVMILVIIVRPTGLFGRASAHRA